MDSNYLNIKELDAIVHSIAKNSELYSSLNIATKAKLLRDCIPRLVEVSKSWVEAGTARRKTPIKSGEEWFQGPVTLIRNLRLYAETLESINKYGSNQLSSNQLSKDQNGNFIVQTFPTCLLDKVLFPKFKVEQRMLTGWDESKIRENQAASYKSNNYEAGVSLVLSAGNAGAIGPGDMLHKLINEQMCVILKLNPINNEIFPFLEYAFKPFIDKGFLKILEGNVEVSKYLLQHKLITDVHLTGSVETYNEIVWGPAGEKREKKIRANEPFLKKPITAELGNVSPVAIAPGYYSKKELSFIVNNIVAMVAQNNSYNCNAAQIIVLSNQWEQKNKFFKLLYKVFQKPLQDTATILGPKKDMIYSLQIPT